MAKVFSLILSFLLVTGALAAAKDKNSPEYSLSGTVVSFHAQQEVDGVGDVVNTYQRRIYVLRTDTGTMEITGWEHGGKAKKRPPLEIGQIIKFRTDGKYIYAVLDDGKEHRFYIEAANQTTPSP
jgi:hypothetical protein